MMHSAVQSKGGKSVVEVQHINIILPVKLRNCAASHFHLQIVETLFSVHFLSSSLYSSSPQINGSHNCVRSHDTTDDALKTTSNHRSTQLGVSRPYNYAQLEKHCADACTEDCEGKTRERRKWRFVFDMHWWWDPRWWCN